MAVGASRGSLSFAFAAILAACPLLQLALALSTGDVLFVNDAAYDSADVLRAPTLTGYSPSGVFRSSLDLSGITYNGTTISDVSPVTTSPDGQYAFLTAFYFMPTTAIAQATNTERLIVVDIQSAHLKVVAVLAIPFPDTCSTPSVSGKEGGFAALQFVTAPGRAAGTYTLYTNPDCGNTKVTSRIGVLAFVYDVQHRTLAFERELLYRGGALKNSPTLSLQAQDYDYLFTIGTTLFALLRNISDNNPRSLLHLESETGAVLSHYVAYSAQKQGCIYPLLNSPSSLYALCDVYPNTWQIKFFQKFKPSVVITRSDKFPTDRIQAMATLGEASGYLTVATLPAPPGTGRAPLNTSVTITKLSRTTGKIVHSFTRPFFGYRMTGLAIVPPQ